MSFPAFTTLHLERDGAVTWLRLDRPARLNALTEEMFAELAAALRAVAADADTRVLVLTGNGRGFCAGSDVHGLEARLGMSAEEQVERLQWIGREVMLALHGLAVPTVAAVNGAASGGGLSLALACDLRVASEEAAFRFGFSAVGLIPDLGATYFLPRVVGLSRACHLLWRNARVTAHEALAMGLVDEVAPGAEFPRRVAGLAAELAAVPQLALRLGRMTMRRASEGRLEDALEAEAVAQSLCLQSADHRAGVRAFLERRATTQGDT